MLGAEGSEILSSDALRANLFLRETAVGFVRSNSAAAFIGR